jgi:hypothetical protein
MTTSELGQTGKSIRLVSLDWLDSATICPETEC